jgi:uncharacterized protein with PIN domain
MMTPSRIAMPATFSPLTTRAIPYDADDASHIRRQIATPGHPVRCPECQSKLRPMAETRDVYHVWSLRCDQCERQLVILNRPEAGRE